MEMHNLSIMMNKFAPKAAYLLLLLMLMMLGGCPLDINK